VCQAIEILKRPKTIIIKSSVIPGTIEALQKKYPRHKFLFNPEFLREVSAYEDFVNPDRQIVGYTNKSKKVAKNILKILPKAPYAKIVPAKTAETVKYMANSFLALKVVFANEFYGLCKSLNIDYNLVRQAVGEDKRIGHSHFVIDHQGYRGYGGSCFPKDVNAIIQLAKKRGLDFTLLESMRKINRLLLKNSGLSEQYFLKELHKRKRL